MTQKAIRIGIAHGTAKSSHVKNPPLTRQVKYAGIPARSEKSRVLLKVSLPGPSAGRGAFLIAGYCESYVRGCINL